VLLIFPRILQRYVLCSFDEILAGWRSGYAARHPQLRRSQSLSTSRQKANSGVPTQFEFDRLENQFATPLLPLVSARMQTFLVRRPLISS
jgi:hypothetical protein